MFIQQISHFQVKNPKTYMDFWERHRTNSANILRGLSLEITRHLSFILISTHLVNSLSFVWETLEVLGNYFSLSMFAINLLSSVCLRVELTNTFISRNYLTVFVKHVEERFETQGNVIFDYNIARYKHSLHWYLTKQDAITKRHVSNNLSAGRQPLTLVHVQLQVCFSNVTIRL